MREREGGRKGGKKTMYQKTINQIPSGYINMKFHNMRPHCALHSRSHTRSHSGVPWERTVHQKQECSTSRTPLSCCGRPSLRKEIRGRRHEIGGTRKEAGSTRAAGGGFTMRRHDVRFRHVSGGEVVGITVSF